MLSVIAAVSDNGVIGHEGGLPWHLPADLRHFRELTTGHTVIMGRRTFESLDQPLARRRSIVLSRQPGYVPAGVETAPSLEAAIAMTAGEDEVFIAGGTEVFREALPKARRLYLTVVHAEVAGDVRFPEHSLDEWRLVSDERRLADERNPFDMSFRSYER